MGAGVTPSLRRLQVLDRGHDPAFGDGRRRAHGLREEADPELLDLPADLPGGAAGPRLGGERGEGALRRRPGPGAPRPSAARPCPRSPSACRGGGRWPSRSGRGRAAGCCPAAVRNPGAIRRSSCARTSSAAGSSTGLRSAASRIRASCAPRRISSAQVTTSYVAACSLRPDVLDDPVERLGVPGGTAGLGDQPVDGAADAVGEQGGNRAVGVVAEHELLRGGQALRDLVGGGLHGEQDEPPGPRAHRALGRGGGLEQPDVYRAARVPAAPASTSAG